MELPAKIIPHRSVHKGSNVALVYFSVVKSLITTITWYGMAWLVLFAATAVCRPFSSRNIRQTFGID
jgi:hypothetical protein